MKLRIAMLAACAGMLLASPVFARDGEPIDGVETKLDRKSRARHQKIQEPKSPPAQFQKTTPGPANPKFKIPDNDSPRPLNR